MQDLLYHAIRPGIKRKFPFLLRNQHYFRNVFLVYFLELSDSLFHQLISDGNGLYEWGLVARYMLILSKMAEIMTFWQYIILLSYSHKNVKCIPLQNKVS